MNPKHKTIDKGQRHTLKKGDVVKYTNLPEQPIAIVVYNNTGNTTTFLIAHQSGKSESFTIASVHNKSYSMGHVCLINPAVTKSHEVSVSISGFAQNDASIDVYLVSLLLPTDKKTLKNIQVKTNRKPVAFKAHSKVSFTPDFGLCDMLLDTTKFGLAGLFFQGDAVVVIGLNLPESMAKHLQDVVRLGPGMEAAKVSFRTSQGTKWSYEIYGFEQPMVYVPISASKSVSGRLSVWPEI